ncbi:MAG TPA: aldehyde dehydrogenase [Parafilimonas sp.]|nr:aldehyde dehydrogenase [Parafilimonas sp.]
MVQTKLNTGLGGRLLAMRDQFRSGATRTYAFRKEQLLNLKRFLLKYEEEINEALFLDLKKSKEETWATETGLLMSEINTALKHLHQWMKPKRVRTNLLNLPSSSFILYEPLGVVMIIGPWNYPLQLLLIPLVGAIAAGNCAVLKGSEFSPATSAVIRKIIEKAFPEQYVLYVEGEGHVIVPELMSNFVFDHIFYTGSAATGKLIYKRAAENLIPVTLELGGKSPCVVESDANLGVAARRIAMTKFSNAGQMCIAPDYLLVHQNVMDEFVSTLTATVKQFFGDPPNSNEYGKIINEKQFDRLINFLNQGEIIFGGKYDKSKLFIEPTIFANVSLESDVMKEEIFGPILPLIGFSKAAEAKAIIEENPNPLAFYVYTSSARKEKFWLENISFGGGCVNNSSWHFTNHHLPFGGRGMSGIGRYHGRYTFETFSHAKSIMKTPTWFDPKLRYPPLKGKLEILKKLIR